MASSLGIFSWTPLKPQHSNPNPNPLANQLRLYWLAYSSHTSHHPSQTPCLPWISCGTQKLILFSWKMLQKQCEAFHTWHSESFSPSLIQNVIAYRSSKLSSRLDCIFEIHQVWQSDFSRVYSNPCCSCSFEREIIKNGQSSHNIYSNKIQNFHESAKMSIVDTNSLNTPRILYIFVLFLVFLPSINIFYAVICFQVFLSNTNNLCTSINFQLTILY